jgi:NitT/TauT family transport system substrate-binding protein
MKRRKLAVPGLMMVVVLALLLSACGAETAGAKADGQKELTKIKIAFNKNGGQTPQYVADTEGFFKKYGLEVERIEFRNNTEMVAAVERGDIDIMASIPGTVLSAREQGFDLVAFMQNETSKLEAPDSGAIIVRKDSGIEDITQLAGKKIAVLTKGSQNTVDGLYLMKNAGVDLDKIDLMEGSFASHFDLLNSKQVDAVITVDPFTTQIVSSGLGKVISYNFVESNPGQPLGAWWAKRANIEKNPEVYRAFGNAIKDSIDFLKADESRMHSIVAAYTGLDIKLVNQMPALAWNYEVDPEVWQKEAEILVEMGALEKQPNPNDYFSDLIQDYVKK